MYFWKAGGWSMYPVLVLGLVALGIAIVASGRPTAPRITLATGLLRAEVYFSVGGYATNLATTFFAVATFEHETTHAMWVMAFTGLYESMSPLIMGLSFVALGHLALAIAAYRLARQAP